MTGPIKAQPGRRSMREGGAGNGEATAVESGGAPRQAGVAAAIEKIKV
jgi:hypothetical protein